MNSFIMNSKSLYFHSTENTWLNSYFNFLYHQSYTYINANQLVKLIIIISSMKITKLVNSARVHFFRIIKLYAYSK
jgi:5'(3')-deoxyribonucleotidase